ncbi:hypothetical protein [Candidatus Enterovibrio escicola]|nr:hypothetical protein [Candidatus Enterovibrio escacola]
MAKGIFKRALHKLKRFLNAVFTLMNVRLKSRTYRCMYVVD